MKYLSIVIIFLGIFNIIEAKLFKTHPNNPLPAPNINNPTQQQPATTNIVPTVTTAPTTPKVQQTSATVTVNKKQPEQSPIPIQKTFSNVEGSGLIALVLKQNNFLLPIQINNKNYTSLLSMKENLNWLFVDKGQFCQNDQCSDVLSDIKCREYTDKTITDTTFIEATRTGKIEYSVNLDKKKRDIDAQFWVANKFTTNFPLSSNLIMINVNDWNNFSIISQGQSLMAGISSQMPNQMVRFDQTKNQKQIENAKTQKNNKDQQNDQENDNQEDEKDEQQNDEDNQNEADNEQAKVQTTQPSNSFLYLSVNNIKKKQLAEKTPIKFVFYASSQGPNMLFSLPQQLGNLLKKSILKQYFVSQCKEKAANKIICKKNVQPINKPFAICNGAENCIQLGLSDLISKNKKIYSYTFTTHVSNQITIFPSFVKNYYDLYFDKGQFIGANKNPQYAPDFVESDQNEENSQNAQANTDTQDPSDQKMSWQKKGIIASIALYGVLGFLCIAIVKSKVSSSFVAGTLDAGFSLFANYFHRKRGYQPSNFTQQIDDSHSVTIGYNQDRNRQLFWEKNSVEGI